MVAVLTYSSLIDFVKVYNTRPNDPTFDDLIPWFITEAEIRCSREVKNLGNKVFATSVLQPSEPVYVKPNRWRETASINFGTATSFETTARSCSSVQRTLYFSFPHPFQTGSSISVFNVTGSGYNGNHTVAAITQTSVTFTGSSGTEAITADTGGVVTAPLNGRVDLLPRSYEFCNSYWPDRSLTGTPIYYADYDYNHFLIVPTPIYGAPFELCYYETPQQLSPSNQTNWLTQYAPDLLLYATLLEASPYLRNDQRIPMWQERFDRAAAAISGENKSRYQDATINRSEG